MKRIIDESEKKDLTKKIETRNIYILFQNIPELNPNGILSPKNISYTYLYFEYFVEFF